MSAVSILLFAVAMLSLAVGLFAWKAQPRRSALGVVGLAGFMVAFAAALATS